MIVQVASFTAKYSIFLFIAALFGYQLFVYLRNIFFHPLSKFPGPILAKASSIPKIRKAINGDYVHWLVELHAKYGEVVRFSPNELSYSSAGSLKDIYGHKTATQRNLAKDPAFYAVPSADTATDIVNSNDEDHSRQRRLFSNAFSDRALKKQEPLFLTYVNQLCDKLRTQLSDGSAQKVNMIDMLNWTTFDVMGDLTFGEPLDMLNSSSYDPWVAAIFANFRFGTYLHAIRCYPFLEDLLKRLIPKEIRRKQAVHKDFCRARVDRRLATHEQRPDIWGLVLQKSQQEGMSKAEMYANSNIFMIAGTETTATLLSGLLFHLLANPRTLIKLKSEIRQAFATEQDISIERLQGLGYLNACVEEGLRLYPPVSQGLPRLVPPGGVQIDGAFVPYASGLRVMSTQLAVHRNPNNFRNPESFVPERWLAESNEYASDLKHALQPFSVGPRACLGKNMAYHEIRLILSKILWNFDLELCEESAKWAEQKIYIMWDKGPLYCRISPKESGPDARSQNVS